MTTPSSTPRNPREIESIFVLGARLTWVAIGPVALILATIGIARNPQGWFTYIDACFGAIVAIMLLGRWIEQRSGCAMTAQGAPATERDFHRYIAGLVGLAGAAWVAANVFANHMS